ncbi:allantoicase [Streptomyces radicis]|uniref:Probable allantoicase n=1 Tax=Streptomyces radicis TaxID=1750517 RepID=A0A3A9W1E7_9ACTN|nr:allantoicase [Streptomyces radicis]RKN06978.1 allantoicase [Streptomyces radicis]RKN15882.1 allantoicase [Streptomyces radicis]
MTTVFTGPAKPYSGGDPYADHRAPDPADVPFTALPDLADRRVGGSVVAASDEFFAERENLLLPGRPVFDPAAFGHKGKIMDGWETRRRRGAAPGEPHPAPGAFDWALIRLGAPGVVRGIVVDTAHFRGNHPHAVAVHGTDDPEGDDWTELVPRTEVGGHAANAFDVAVERRLTHLRLAQYPDGGVARLRAHGEAVPDPAWLAALGTFDLLALENGGLAEDASDRFYSPPVHTTHPGRPRTMDEGWETRRRRDAGHDWLRYRLAGEATVRAVEIDTGTYKGNAPGWASLSVGDGDAWTEVLPRTPLLPDAVHRFVLEGAPPATHARLDVFPDGGIGRLRLHGTLTDAGARGLADRYRALGGR